MTRAFYSFHFDDDVSRVAQVRNMKILTGDQIIDDNSWEQVKRGGDDRIRDWIAKQMAACDVVIVLVGARTSSRPWVRHEICHAWDNRKPMVGIRIHGLKDFDRNTSAAGVSPFSDISLKNGARLSEHVPLHDPSGATSQAVYADISRNMLAWVKGAAVRR